MRTSWASSAGLLDGCAVAWQGAELAKAVGPCLDPVLKKILVDSLGEPEFPLWGAKVTELYAEWCQLVPESHMAALKKLDAELKLTTKTFLSLPEPGGWVCPWCVSRRPNWEDTVDAVEEIWPGNVIVRSFEKDPRMTPCVGNVQRGQPSGNYLEAERLPKTLTHGAVWNTVVSKQCWRCQSGPPSRPHDYRTVYLCPACNPAEDIRAAPTANKAMDRTMCPMCVTWQPEDAPHWENYRSDEWAATRIFDRMRKGGCGLPRLPNGDRWLPPPTPSLPLRRPERREGRRPERRPSRRDESQGAEECLPWSRQASSPATGSDQEAQEMGVDGW